MLSNAAVLLPELLSPRQLANRILHGNAQLAYVIINYSSASTAAKTMKETEIRINNAARSSLPVKRTETFQPKAVFDQSMTIAGKLVFEANTSLNFLRGR